MSFVAPSVQTAPCAERAAGGAMIRIAEIQQATAEYYGIAVELMRTPSGPGKNAHEISHPRQIAMYLASELTDHSASRIGDFFGGRDHTTVLYAIKQVARRIEKIGPSRIAVSRITKFLQDAHAAEYGLELAA